MLRGVRDGGCPAVTGLRLRERWTYLSVKVASGPVLDSSGHKIYVFLLTPSGKPSGTAPQLGPRRARAAIGKHSFHRHVGSGLGGGRGDGSRHRALLDRAKQALRIGRWLRRLPGSLGFGLDRLGRFYRHWRRCRGWTDSRGLLDPGPVHGRRTFFGRHSLRRTSTLSCGRARRRPGRLPDRLAITVSGK